MPEQPLLSGRFQLAITFGKDLLRAAEPDSQL